MRHITIYVWCSEEMDVVQTYETNCLKRLFSASGESGLRQNFQIAFLLIANVEENYFVHFYVCINKCNH
jgi:hypothetical protein